MPVPPSLTPPQQGSARTIRVTIADDGEFLNRGYSYWSQAWVNEGANAYLVFAGHADGHVRFFQVDRTSGSVTRVGTPFTLQPYTGTAEGWYFDAAGWVYLCDGPRLRRINPMGMDDSADQIVFSIEGQGWDQHRLWQTHSSDDGMVHSATVQLITTEGPYQNIGTVVSVDGRQQFFQAQQPLDESQVTPDGRWLVIKEGNDNRIINLETLAERWILDADGAVGHSDCGPGYVIGEDDQHGACVVWDLAAWTVRELFPSWNVGHLSVKAGTCLRSYADGFELVGMEGALDDSDLTPLPGHGMISDGTYDTQVFANLDATAQVAAYMSNAAGRMDLYLLDGVRGRTR